MAAPPEHLKSAVRLRHLVATRILAQDFQMHMAHIAIARILDASHMAFGIERIAAK